MFMLTLPEKLLFGLNDLIEMIRQTDIDLALWGNLDIKPPTKSVTHLIDEVNDGYAILSLEGDTLTRHIAIVGMFVYFKPYPDELLVLEEKAPKDGDMPRPDILKPYSIINQLHRDDIPCQKAFETINTENLQIPIHPFQILTRRRFQGKNPKYHCSNPYPGITTLITIHTVECYLDIRQFNPKGYTEVQDNKKHFHWVPMIPSQPV